MLRAEDLCFSYFNGRVVSHVNLALGTGDLVGLIGPNGSGKTTLLKLLSGVLKPALGHVSLEGREVQAMERREIARRVAVVPQELHVPFPFTVREMVSMGRTPYVRPLVGLTAEDRQVVLDVMGATGIGDLAGRDFATLSGGEQQRVIIAMALAQEPRFLLLDEPTVHLDLNHQVEILELIRRLNREKGVAVLAALHDLNLAALYFDRLVLLNRGAIVATGTPTQVLTAARILEVFSASVLVEAHPVTRAPQVTVVPLSQQSAGLEGPGAEAPIHKSPWTRP
ncbi:MAG: heme ABC transporter ATP-binding protein [Chloroflexi bacterium]|nr:heme ABC transporter ATP-binding protein [Chloroflexota bacterium]